MIKRGILVLTLCAAASQSFAFATFFFGQDAGVAPGNPFPLAAQGQRDWASVAAGLSSISAINYETSPLGAGIAPYNPLPGVTVSMDNVQAGFSGVMNTDNGQLGWNTTPLGSKHLRFAPSFNNQVSKVTFKFGALINSFSTIYTGAQNDFAGEFEMRGFRNGIQKWGMTQGKPAPVNNNTSVGHYGFVTDDAGLFFDEVRFLSVGDRTNSSDNVGLDDTFFTYCQAVPEPTTIAALGLGALAMIRRRARK